MTFISKLNNNFKQQTEDMNFTQELNSYEKENKEFLEEWTNTYSLIHGVFCTSNTGTAVKERPEFET